VKTENPRILFVNRSNAYSQPGGDTVLMDSLASELRQQGIDVTIDLNNKENVKNYSLVHLFNFTLSQWLYQQAQNARTNNVPYVVTSLSEDIPKFHKQSHVVADTLIKYVTAENQNYSWWDEHRYDCYKIEKAPSVVTKWVVENAAAIFVCGDEEERSIKKTAGEVGKFYKTFFGFQKGINGDPRLFEKEFGVKDFVLCVGRIESRKNQLMLLKALEYSDLTVVLAGGGFSYQPEYEYAVKNFKRKGKTIITGRLSEEQLASAYAACRVHVLPSWYELPGMVTLEAAACGKNVVTSDWGTIKDYLKDKAFYCDPSNESSIYNATIAAWNSPVDQDLKVLANSYSWARTANDCINAYKDILSFNNQVTVENSDWIKPVEDSAASGDFSRALDILNDIEKEKGASSEIYRVRGTIYLAKGEVSSAKDNLQKSLSFNENNPRTLSALGICKTIEGDIESAYNYFSSSLSLDPFHLITIHQLLQCSYSLKKYKDITTILEKYVSKNTNDIDLKFCLAGCYYKNEEYKKAQREIEDILSTNSTYKGAEELKIKIEESLNVATSSLVSSSTAINYESMLVEVDELKREGKYQDALNKIREIKNIEAFPENIQEWGYSLLADLETLGGNSTYGKELYNKMRSKWPNSTKAICGLGTIEALAGKWTEAERFFHQARSMNSQSDIALAGLGLCAHIAKDTMRAWEWYYEALKYNPENVRALLGVIELGYSCGKLREVEKAIENYLESHPADLNFIYSLAGCYYAQNKLEDAVEQINKITLFNPEHEKALELSRMIEEKRSGSFNIETSKSLV